MGTDDGNLELELADWRAEFETVTMRYSTVSLQNVFTTHNVINASESEKYGDIVEYRLPNEK